MLFMLFFTIHNVLFAQNEIGPEGHKLIWVFLVLLLVSLFFLWQLFGKRKKTGRKGFFKYTRVEISLVKDRLYYPDNLKLTIKNKGNTDIDLERPLLIFDSFWIKRKFRLKGTHNARIYPLYLEVNKTHILDIELNSFYQHDKKLKRYAKAKIILETVHGKRLGSKAVYLRKTLFRY